MSRVTPSRFWAKSSCKMGSFSGRREKKKSFLNFILMEKWDFRVVLLLMRSFFAWLAIKASNLPIMKLEMFHLYSQMDFFKLLLADCFFLLSFFLFPFFLLVAYVPGGISSFLCRKSRFGVSIFLMCSWQKLMQEIVYLFSNTLILFNYTFTSCNPKDLLILP